MLRVVICASLFLGLSHSVHAQDIALQQRALDAPATQSTRPGHLHVTRMLMESPDGQEAIRLLKEWQDSGSPPLRKSGSGQAVIGQVQSFLIQDVTTAADDAVAVDFTLLFEHDSFDIWVETSQLIPSGPVEQSDVDALAEALGSSTPQGSFNPNQGIIVNDEAIFGPPPNVDGDGRTDVLLHDITDFYDPDNGQLSAILGYFDPSDLTRYNFRDIIHLDVYPGMFDQSGNRRSSAGVQQTLAHEYQHLIFARYNTGDASFVDEGLAEWAEVQNGFSARSINYLASASWRTSSFMNWTPSPNGGGAGGEDYQRAGLFTNYFSERVGVLDTGALTRSTGRDAGNYIVELNRLTGGDGVNTLKDFVQGFHIANILNDRSVAPNYGHEQPQYAAVRATNITTYDGTESFSSTATSTTSAGGVIYAQWTDVGNISISVSTPGSTNSALLRPAAIGIPNAGPTQVIPFDPNSEGANLTGDFSRVLLVIPHVDLATTESATATYSASWSTQSNVLTFEEIAYDTGSYAVNSSGNYDLYSLDPAFGFPVDTRLAHRFTTPNGMRLERLSVALLYTSQFPDGSPSSTAMDFRVRLYGSTADTTPLPGPELLSFDVTDAVTHSPPDYTFLDINLSAYEDVLRNLPSTFFVSIENTGTDDNYMVVGMSPFTGPDSPGAMYHPFGSSDGSYSWASFNTIASGGETILNDRALPLRATFSDRPFSTADEDHVVLPETTVLSPNFPNPFNPTTTIAYTLPTSGDVRLTVHDLLGREVAVLVDGPIPAGTHQVRFDASNVTSGLYLYTLETSGTSQTRSMLLIK